MQTNRIPLRQRDWARSALLISLGVVLTLGVQFAFRYVRYAATRDHQMLLVWAWRDVPQIIGSRTGTTVRTLDAEFTGAEELGTLRLIYDQDGSVRVISAPYRVVKGRVVEPTESELIRLAQTASAAQPGTQPAPNP